MSSRLSVVKQKVLEKVGAGHLTKDEEYDRFRTNLFKLGDMSAAMRSKVAKFCGDMKALLTSSYAVSDEFKLCYERSPVPVMTTIALKFERVHLSAKNEKLLIFEKEFNEHVLKPLMIWAESISKAKARLELREASRQKYDHYVRKLSQLRDEHNEMVAKGKTPQPKEVDKLKRNELKYEESKRSYEVTNDQVMAEMKNAWETRFEVLDPIYTKIVATETLYLVTFSKELFALNGDLKRAATYKAELSAAGTGAAGAGDDAAAASAADDGGADAIPNPLARVGSALFDTEGVASDRKRGDSGAGLPPKRPTKAAAAAAAAPPIAVDDDSDVESAAAAGGEGEGQSGHEPKAPWQSPHHKVAEAAPAAAAAGKRRAAPVDGPMPPISIDTAHGKMPFTTEQSPSVKPSAAGNPFDPPSAPASENNKRTIPRGGAKAQAAAPSRRTQPAAAAAPEPDFTSAFGAMSVTGGDGSAVEDEPAAAAHTPAPQYVIVYPSPPVVLINTHAAPLPNWEVVSGDPFELPFPPLTTVPPLSQVSIRRTAAPAAASRSVAASPFGETPFAALPPPAGAASVHSEGEPAASHGAGGPILNHMGEGQFTVRSAATAAGASTATIRPASTAAAAAAFARRNSFDDEFEKLAQQNAAAAAAAAAPPVAAAPPPVATAPVRPLAAAATAPSQASNNSAPVSRPVAPTASPATLPLATPPTAAVASGPAGGADFFDILGSDLGSTAAAEPSLSSLPPQYDNNPFAAASAPAAAAAVASATNTTAAPYNPLNNKPVASSALPPAASSERSATPPAAATSASKPPPPAYPPPAAAPKPVATAPPPGRPPKPLTAKPIIPVKPNAAGALAAAAPATTPPAAASVPMPVTTGITKPSADADPFDNFGVALDATGKSAFDFAY